MKKNVVNALLASSASIAIFNGCTGTEAVPNNATQTGAVTGAIAGSAIGYNTKGHNRGQRALVGGLLGAAVGAGVGSAIDSQNPEPEQTGGWQ
ncbi:MAG: glycine zipper domain-containing protein [Campylobacterota bacterium]|nr:glycine zipper domain-containing protein [Campylobacterota bacterium]